MNESPLSGRSSPGGAPLGDVVVEARNLSKTYRDFWGRSKKVALKPLDLEIRRGEIFGLLGPNGSGKTTTMKLLLGLIFPTSGEALVFGRGATDVSKNERIGYLPEESYLYKFLDAEETLDFYGRLFDMPPEERKRRADALIEMVGLGRDKKRQLKEDQFVTTTFQLAGYLQEHRNQAILVVAGVVALILIASFLIRFQVSSRESTQNLLSQGVGMYQAGNYADAAYRLSTFLRNHPRHGEAVYAAVLCGDANFYLSRYEDAGRYYRMALEKAAEGSEYWFSARAGLAAD